MSTPRFRATLQRHWFLIGLLLAVLFAVFDGATRMSAYTHHLARWGSAFMFFTQGLLLDLASLRRGLFTWRIHVAAQLNSFVLLPLVGCLLFAFSNNLPPSVRVGLLYLAALPCTLSSAVVLTAAAQGNVAAAALNAALSNTAGLALTPVLLRVLPWAASLVFPALGSLAPQVSEAQAFDLGSSLLLSAEWLFAPFVLGQLMRPALGHVADRYRNAVLSADQLIVLFLVYASIHSAQQQAAFSSLSHLMLLGVGASAALLLAIGSFFALLFARGLSLNAADTTSVLFCGSHKTLAAGVPMAHILFHGSPNLGGLLLPLLIYHPLQLLVGAWLVAKRRAASSPTPPNKPIDQL